MKDPTYWKNPNRKPRLLKLELKCSTLKKTKDARYGICEALREIGYSQKDWKFEMKDLK